MRVVLRKYKGVASIGVVGALLACVWLFSGLGVSLGGRCAGRACRCRSVRHTRFRSGVAGFLQGRGSNKCVGVVNIRVPKRSDWFTNG